MPLLYHPKCGEVVVCSYPKDMAPPEMVKTRPVIIISPRLRKRNGLATIVPLSTTKPTTVMPYHCELDFSPQLPYPWSASPCWAICDHLITVSLERLDLIKLQKDQYGKRRYYQSRLSSDDIDRVKNAVLHGLGLA